MGVKNERECKNKKRVKQKGLSTLEQPHELAMNSSLVPVVQQHTKTVTARTLEGDHSRWSGRNRH